MTQAEIKSVERVDQALVIAIAGELTTPSVPALQASLSKHLEDRPKRLILLMSGITFVDSSGLAMLIELRKTMGDKNVYLVDMVKEVARLVSIMKLDALFVCVDDLNQAMGDTAG